MAVKNGLFVVVFWSIDFSKKKGFAYICEQYHFQEEREGSDADLTCKKLWPVQQLIIVEGNNWTDGEQEA
jgi:hypothetical protein